MKIKICGITHLEDAVAAVESGADMLGFNFYSRSPRCISPAGCSAILSGLAHRNLPVVSVGIFVNTLPSQVAVILAECGLAQAQLSGDEPPEDLEFLGERAYKSLRPENAHAMAELAGRYPPRSIPPAWLVDASIAGQYGGTGQAADWSLARALAGQAPVLLAGGLRSENVAEAIAKVRPWGVDVASGVESSPGRKDKQKVAAFIHAVRHISQEEGL